jgi:aminoglycoside phosphotransferase (APT) family kinase protein
MRSHITPSHARVAAAPLLAEAIDDVRQVPSFAGNRVFRVASTDQVMFVKFAAREDVAREAAVLAIAASRGVPVPGVATADVHGADPFLALWQVTGHPLHGGEAVYADVGALLHRVHGVVVRGFGSIAGTDRIIAPHASWLGALRDRVDAAQPVVDAGLVPAHLVDRAHAALEEQASTLVTVEEARLLHGDFNPRHVYAHAGSITAVVDWGDATAGDPCYDLARILHSGLLSRDLGFGLDLVRAALTTYPDAPEVDRQLVDRLLIYAAVFILSSMQGEYAGGAPWPPWWPAQAAALSRVLDELDR